MSSTNQCQKQLKQLWQQTMTYKTSFKDVEDLKKKNPSFLTGEKLRQELIKRGYLDKTDFRCPATPTRSLNRVHFTGLLFPQAIKFKYPVFWEKRIGTHIEHSDEMNVVFSDGEARSMHSDDFFEALTAAFSNWRNLKLKKGRGQ
jgi:hypothetical protein